VQRAEESCGRENMGRPRWADQERAPPVRIPAVALVFRDPPARDVVRAWAGNCLLVPSRDRGERRGGCPRRDTSFSWRSGLGDASSRPAQCTWTRVGSAPGWRQPSRTSSWGSVTVGPSRGPEFRYSSLGRFVTYLFDEGWGHLLNDTTPDDVAVVERRWSRW